MVRRHWWFAVGLAGSFATAAFTVPPLGAAVQKMLCPVTGGEFIPGPNAPSDTVNDLRVQFCCNDCVRQFRTEPEKYLLLRDKGHCPVTGNPARSDAALRLVVNNHLYYFCSDQCPKEFAKQPATYFKSLVDPVSKKPFAPTAKSPYMVYRGQHYFFATPAAKAKFDQAPDQYLLLYGEKQP